MNEHDHEANFEDTQDCPDCRKDTWDEPDEDEVAVGLHSEHLDYEAYGSNYDR